MAKKGGGGRTARSVPGSASADSVIIKKELSYTPNRPAGARTFVLEKGLDLSELAPAPAASSGPYPPYFSSYTSSNTTQLCGYGASIARLELARILYHIRAL